MHTGPPCGCKVDAAICLSGFSSGALPGVGDVAPEWYARLSLFKSGRKLDNIGSHALDDPLGEHTRHTERFEPSHAELLPQQREAPFNLDAPVCPDLSPEGCRQPLIRLPLPSLMLQMDLEGLESVALRVSDAPGSERTGDASPFAGMPPRSLRIPLASAFTGEDQPSPVCADEAVVLLHVLHVHAPSDVLPVRTRLAGLPVLEHCLPRQLTD